MSKYEVFPSNENCDKIIRGELILATDDLTAAKKAASHASYIFGAAILDTESNQIDFGHGFGVAVPEISEDE